MRLQFCAEPEGEPHQLRPLRIGQARQEVMKKATAIALGVILLQLSVFSGVTSQGILVVS